MNQIFALNNPLGVDMQLNKSKLNQNDFIVLRNYSYLMVIIIIIIIIIVIVIIIIF